MKIRDATPSDAAELIAIYRPIVEETAISFEVTPPSEQELARRIDAVGASHAWFVAETDGALSGYVYATPHRPREAYRYSVETSAYVRAEYRGLGIGAHLYRHLFGVLRERQFFHAFAGITLPNPASIALHRTVGFTAIGTFPKVGYKFGRWHDVSWWYRKIQDGHAVEPL